MCCRIDAIMPKVLTARGSLLSRQFEAAFAGHFLLWTSQVQGHQVQPVQHCCLFSLAWLASRRRTKSIESRPRAELTGASQL